MRRRLRTVGRVVRGVVAALALLVGGGVLFLHTPWGGELLRRVAVGQIDGAIAGHLAVDRLRFGTNRLRLAGVELRDPEGGLVARVRELDVAFSPIGLLRRRIDLSRVSIIEPELRLRDDRRGSNLSRALASRRPAAPAPPPHPGEQSSGLAVDVGDLEIAGGVIDYRTEAAGAERHVRLEDLEITAYVSGRFGAVGVGAGDPPLDAGLDGHARMVAPFAAPLSFHAGAQAAMPTSIDARLRVALGGSSLEAKGRLASDGKAVVHVEKLRAVPRLLDALFPTLRVQAPVELTADLSRTGSAIAVRADVHAAGARVEARASVDIEHRRARSVVVEGRDVDLGAVVAILPPSQLGFTLHADGGGPDLERLDGVLSLEVPAGRLDGAAVGPLSVSVRAAGGRIEVRPFALELPGLTIAGSGTSDRGRLDGDFQIRAADLALTARSLASAGGGAPLPIAGRGDLALQIGGSQDAPAIDARGRFAALDVAGQSARDLSFAVRVPNLRRPEIAEAHVRSATAVAGGRSLSDVRLDLRSQQRQIAADLGIGGGKPLALSLRGRWTRDRRAATVESFSLASGGVRWTQEGPVRLGFGAGRVTVSGLDLRNGAQRLGADIDAREQKLTARLDLSHLDLAALPRPLLPANAPVLEGMLDLHADVSGTKARPEITAQVGLARGRVGRYRGLVLAIDGRYAGERARATIAASGLGASVRGTIDVPTRWPVRDPRAPVAADLRIEASDVGEMFTAAQTAGAVAGDGESPFGGRFAATLHLAGTAGDPTIVLHAETGGLRARKHAIGEVVVDARGGGDQPVRVALRFGGRGGATRELATGTLSVETPVALRTLLGSASHRDWMATPVAVSGDLQHISLSELGALARRPSGVAGTASVRLDLRGSARAPTGSMNLIVLGAHGPRFPETDVRLDAALGARDVRLAAQVVRNQHLLAWANAVAELAAARLGDRAALVSAPIHVRAGAGPVDLKQMPLDGLAATTSGMPAAKTGGAGALHARALVDLAIDGTLRAPSVRASAQLRALKNGSIEAGAIQALLTYADRRATLDAQLTSAAGGNARVRGSAGLDLGYPAITHAADVARAPVEVKVDANALDLEWMSGLISPIRRIAGRLTLAAHAHGTIGSLSSRSSAAPLAISGRLEWADGALGLVGYGGYRGIHLVAHGDEHAIVLDGLDVRGREGRAYLKGSVSRTADGHAAQLTAKVDRFPIYSQGELLGQVSLDGSAQATAVHGRADGTLKIGELHAELAAQPRNLQPLARPNDIVLVSDGEPIDHGEAVKLRRLLAARQRVAEKTAQKAAGQAAGAPAEPEAAPPFTAHIAVDAPRNLWLKSDDAELEVGLERGFHIEAGESVRVFGQVSLGRGHVDLLGRRLELQSGSTARFVGPPAVPIIDVSAKFVDDKDNLTVLLRAQGPIDELKIDISAPDHPELTQTQLYTVLVVGHLQSGGDSGGSATGVSSSALSAEAGSLVAGVLASQLQRVLAKRLPLDVLSIQTGEGLAGSRLEAGKYVSRNIYVGYVGRAGANPALLQNRNAVRVEYKISQRWSFDAEYGDAGTGTADLMWTKHY